MISTRRVDSAKSDRVTAVRALHARAGRRKAGRFLVEGPQAVLSAIDAGVVIRDLFMDDDAGVVFPAILAAARDAGIAVTGASSAALRAMAETEAPQGILAVCDLLPPVDLDAVMAAPGPIVLLDAVTDPGNVGTVIRTADAVGAAAVLLGAGSADPHNGKVVRSTAGSLFHLPVGTDAQVDEVAAACRRHGRTLAVATGDAETDLFAAVSSGRVSERSCWVVGSEAHGVGEAARAAADVTVRIPMVGRTESLNAAVAVSVVLYVTAYEASSRA